MTLYALRRSGRIEIRVLGCCGVPVPEELRILLEDEKNTQLKYTRCGRARMVLPPFAPPIGPPPKKRVCRVANGRLMQRWLRRRHWVALLSHAALRNRASITGHSGTVSPAHFATIPARVF